MNFAAEAAATVAERLPQRPGGRNALWCLSDVTLKGRGSGGWPDVAR